MADKNLDGNGLSEVWVRAAQLVKKYTGAVDSAKGDLQTQVNEKLSGTDDTKDNTVTFTSADELNPTAWKDVNVLSSKEKHLSLLNKISTMFSNVRYLYNILGTTDISALGTVTQAIATLNGNVGSIKGISSSAAITTQGQYALDAREKNASINGTLANELSKVNSNFNLPSFMSSFWGICEDANNPTAFIISGVTQNAPDGVNYPVILTMPQRDTADYLGQICFSVTAQGSDNLYVRNKRGDTWKPWYMVNLTAI